MCGHVRGMRESVLSTPYSPLHHTHTHDSRHRHTHASCSPLLTHSTLAITHMLGLESRAARRNNNLFGGAYEYRHRPLVGSSSAAAATVSDKRSGKGINAACAAPAQCATDRTISVCVRFHPTRSPHRVLPLHTTHYLRCAALRSAPRVECVLFNNARDECTYTTHAHTTQLLPHSRTHTEERTSFYLFQQQFASRVVVVAHCVHYTQISFCDLL